MRGRGRQGFAQTQDRGDFWACMGADTSRATAPGGVPPLAGATFEMDPTNLNYSAINGKRFAKRNTNPS